MIADKLDEIIDKYKRKEKVKYGLEYQNEGLYGVWFCDCENGYDTHMYEKQCPRCKVYSPFWKEQIENDNR